MSTPSIRHQAGSQHPKTTSSAKMTSPVESQYSAKAQAPDLVIDRFDLNPAFPKAGDRAFLDVRVKNAGNSAATSFQVSVDGTALPLTEKKVKTLAPQSHQMLRFGPVKMSLGNYSFTARADSRHDVVESEETNNWNSMWFSVNDPFPPQDPWR